MHKIKTATGRRLLLVDLSYQSYRACAAHPLLSSGDTFTGGLYGFIVSVTKAIETVGATHIVVCRDTKPYVRSTAYPEYKMLRKKAADQELLERHNATMPVLLDMLQTLRVPLWEQSGFECDDLIARAVRKHKHRFEMIVAMSSDSDLYQLFDAPCFRMWKDAKSPLIDAHQVYTKWGVPPHEIPGLLALMGTHNDIAGVPGVGPVSARIAMRSPESMRKLRAVHAELIDRNLKLIQLPHKDLPIGRDPVGARAPDFDVRGLYRFCGRYDIAPMPHWGTAFEKVLL